MASRSYGLGVAGRLFFPAMKYMMIFIALIVVALSFSWLPMLVLWGCYMGTPGMNLGMMIGAHC